MVDLYVPANRQALGVDQLWLGLTHDPYDKGDGSEDKPHIATTKEAISQPAPDKPPESSLNHGVFDALALEIPLLWR